MTSVIARIGVDLEANSAKFTAGLREAEARMAETGSKWSKTLAGIADRAESLSQRIDGISKVGARASTALDAFGQVGASTFSTGLSGRASEVAEALNFIAGAARLASDKLAPAATEADSLGASAEVAAVAVDDLAQSTGDMNAQAEAGVGVWVAGAAAVGLFAAAAYGVSKAIDHVRDEQAKALQALSAWLQGITTADLEAKFGADAMAAAKTIRELGRELGVSAGNLAAIGNVARNYGTSQDQATSAARRMVDVLDPLNESTAKARQVLEDYGISVKGATADQWAQKIDAFAAALNNVRDSTQKTRDIIAVLGTDGPAAMAATAARTEMASSAMTEVQRISAATAQVIADSQARIAKGPDKTYFDALVEDIGRAFSRSEEFKAQQEYASAELVTAWQEYKAGIGGIPKLWDNATKAAADYVAVLRGTLVVPQGVDGRPPAPTVSAEDWRKFYAQKPVADKSVEEAGRQLEEMKRQKENWFSWNLHREAQYWRDMKAQVEREWSESMSPQDIAAHPTMQAFDTKIAAAEMGAAREMKSQTDAANASIEQQIAALKFQEDQLGRTAREQAIYAAVQQAGAQASTAQRDAIAAAAGSLYDKTEAVKAATEAVERQNQVEEARLEAQFRQQEARDGIAAGIGQEVADNERLIAALRVSQAEYERVAALLDLLNKYRAAGVNMSADEIAAAEETAKKLGDQRTVLGALHDKSRSLDKLGKDLGKSFSSAFADAVTGAKSLSESINALGRDILRLMTQAAITEPLSKAMSPLFGGLMTGLGGFLGFASGTSSAPPGMAWVGERGPELINFRGGEQVYPAMLSKQIAAAYSGLPGYADGAFSFDDGGPVGGGDIKVNIINNAGDDVTAQRRMASGGMELDVMIDQAVSKKLGQRGGQSNKAMRQTFGAREQLVQR